MASRSYQRPIKGGLPAEVIDALHLYHEDKLREDELLAVLEPYLISDTAFLPVVPARGVSREARQNNWGDDAPMGK